MNDYPKHSFAVNLVDESRLITVSLPLDSSLAYFT